MSVAVLEHVLKDVGPWTKGEVLAADRPFPFRIDPGALLDD